MRRIVLLIGMSLATSMSSAQGFSRSYWLVADNQRHEWCGYIDPSAYQSEAAKLKATHSAIVTYKLGELTGLTQQWVADNGSWVVIDQYTPSRGVLQLQRTDMLPRQDLRVVQSASIQGGKIGPLRTREVTTLQGQPASAPANLTLPAVAVLTDLSKAPYMLLVTQMRHESVPTLCRRVQ